MAAVFRPEATLLPVLDWFAGVATVLLQARPPELGTIRNSLDFQNLYRYSPLHAIRKGVDYPATLVMASDHDDRVVPAHSYAFTAALQENSSGAYPVLLPIETGAGHIYIPSLEKMVDQLADMLRLDIGPGDR